VDQPDQSQDGHRDPHPAGNRGPEEPGRARCAKRRRVQRSRRPGSTGGPGRGTGGDRHRVPRLTLPDGGGLQIPSPTGTRSVTAWSAPPGPGGNAAGRLRQQATITGDRPDRRYRNSPNQYSSDQVPTGVVHSPLRSDTGGMAGPVGAAVEVLVTRPDPPAALACREEPAQFTWPVHRSGRPPGVRHVPPLAVPAAVDAEGDGVPVQIKTVRQLPDTPRSIRGCESILGDDLRMARLGARPGGTGNKPAPIGTWSLTTRLPRDLESLIRHRAAEQNLSCSDVVANAVAASFDRALVMAPRPDNPLDQQDELLAS